MEVGKEKSEENKPQFFSLGDWEEGVAEGKNRTGDPSARPGGRSGGVAVVILGATVTHAPEPALGSRDGSVLLGIPKPDRFSVPVGLKH